MSGSAPAALWTSALLFFSVHHVLMFNQNFSFLGPRGKRRRNGEACIEGLHERQRAHTAEHRAYVLGSAYGTYLGMHRSERSVQYTHLLYHGGGMHFDIYSFKRARLRGSASSYLRDLKSCYDL